MFVTEELGLEKQTRFLTFRQDPASFIQAADCVVLSSEFEAFGLVLLEAIACGTPAISSRCGGPQEILDNRDEFLYDVADITALSQRIEFVKQNPDVARKLTMSLRDRALTIFDKDAVVDKYLSIYSGEYKW